MHQQSTCTPWKITCRSPEDAEAIQQWLASRIDLERILTDTLRVTPDGVEQVQVVRHRLGDYFADIRLLPDAQTPCASFKLIFQKRPEAGRFWKDLMVNILQEIKAGPREALVELDAKGEMDL